eukprot:1630526-Pleurochrysis_carterae.AAC.1
MRRANVRRVERRTSGESKDGLPASRKANVLVWLKSLCALGRVRARLGVLGARRRVWVRLDHACGCAWIMR